MSRQGLGILNDEKEQNFVDPYNFFGSIPIEQDMEKGTYVSVLPTLPIDENQTAPIIMEFKNPGVYWDAKNSLLEGELEVEKIDGTPMSDDNTDEYSVVNMLPIALFKQINLEMNGVETTENTSSNHAYKAFIDALVSFSSDAKNDGGTLESSFYYQDNPDSVDVKALSSASGFSNNIWKQKYDRLKAKDNKLFFSTQLYVDPLNTPFFIPPHVHPTLTVHRNSNAFLLITKFPDKYRIKLKKLKWIVHTITPSREKLAKHEKLFDNGAIARIPFVQSRLNHFLLPGNCANIVINNITPAILPKTLYCVMVDHKSFNGTHDTNPFHFKHNNVTSFEFRVNNDIYPTDRYKLDFKKGDYLPLYRDFMNAVGIGHDNASNNISLELFEKVYTIFTLDLTPDHCSGFQIHNPQSGNISLEITFEKVITEPITLLVYGLYNKVLEIKSPGPNLPPEVKVVDVFENTK